MPANILDVLTTLAPYKVRRLLGTGGFVTFCRDRGEHIDAARLRKLEQLGLFKPLLRIRQPDDVRKVEIISATQYRDLGSLEEGEVWAGETRTDLLRFDFHPSIVASWREHDLLWSPLESASPHDLEIDTDPARQRPSTRNFRFGTSNGCSPI